MFTSFTHLSPHLASRMKGLNSWKISTNTPYFQRNSFTSLISIFCQYDISPKKILITSNCLEAKKYRSLLVQRQRLKGEKTRCLDYARRRLGVENTVWKGEPI